jgi:hypothetical protein
MSLLAPRTYLRTRLENLGFTEWTDGFNIENIPSTIIVDSFHIESGSIDGSASSHQPHQFSSNLTLRVWLQGFGDPAEAIDESMTVADTIYADILSPSNRLTGAVKDVVPSSFSVIPLATSNDNTVQLEFSLVITTYIKY